MFFPILFLFLLSRSTSLRPPTPERRAASRGSTQLQQAYTPAPSTRGRAHFLSVSPFLGFIFFGNVLKKGKKFWKGLEGG